MTDEGMRRQRLEELLDLAQVYRGWNRRKLALALRRDASNLSPASGLPKLDLLVELARVLEWCVEDVVKCIWLDDIIAPHVEEAGVASADFDELSENSRRAHRAGRGQEAVQLARHASIAATSPEERAIACIRESSAWDALGRYACAMEASRRGLAESGVSTVRRRLLQTNLANEYYVLWHPLEARSMAHDLIRIFDDESANTRTNRVIQAYSHYVRGNSSRRLMAVEPEQRRTYAKSSRDDLRTAHRLFSQLADDYADEAYRGVANTCRGGVVEAEVALGERDAQSALAIYNEGLESIVAPDEGVAGDWLESYGWWCIYGCNIVLRHIKEPAEVHKHLAVFTNKADEIANRTNNWAMRERIVTLEFARRRRFDEWTGLESDWTIDTEDVRAIAGTMGRFPSFHETGWRILRTSRIVKD